MNSIRLTGDINKMVKHLKKMENVDFGGMGEAIASMLRKSTVKRFNQETDPSGKKWLPSERAKSRGGKTLLDTARLRNSIRRKSDSRGNVAVGTNTIYAARHQFGDKKPFAIKAKTKKGLRFKVGGQWVTKSEVRVKLPARPFLGISESDIEGIGEILKETMEGSE